jgi:hypothetical protein
MKLKYAQFEIEGLHSDSDGHIFQDITRRIPNTSLTKNLDIQPKQKCKG